MKAQLINQHVYQNKSFFVEDHYYKNFLNTWHYHPELELVIILESTGTRFVGDSIEKFEPEEIVLIGKNLPHMWLNDKIYFEESSYLKAKAHVIHLHESFIANLSEIPEMNCIYNLLHRAGRGIKFNGTTKKKIISCVNEMFNLPPYEKVLRLFAVLKLLAEQKSVKILSSAGYTDDFNVKKDGRIEKVYEYVMNNFRKDICLDKASEVANMNASAFSRYFKKNHKKTFTQFVNEVRIGYACKLLIEQKFNIAEICYKSGFNNVSNFNRQFKSFKKMTPSEFIDLHKSTN